MSAANMSKAVSALLVAFLLVTPIGPASAGRAGLNITIDAVDDSLAANNATIGRELQQWGNNFAPANCPNGWSITGDCVTAEFYIPPRSTTRYYYNNRCNGGWTQALVRAAAGAASCARVTPVCGPFAPACAVACAALVSVAQAQCLDITVMRSSFATRYLTSNFVCCKDCNLWNKILRKCP
ncbi:hypothetical protein GPECTOR_7g974 [Gonium pectorale]|uniref:Expansin-like EG45 domain-containing protein n=1 Tax=Gonium pectorale TaxID=33097 RepID=A0A150GUQ6_GONPE|nr:hypothetical protein GPECTOR_7g974 [Gonium pectorale]|eukprot:KXZ53524.1 hypothetical protein GPECTOR_7g974 [Gonium pectorale]